MSDEKVAVLTVIAVQDKRTTDSEIRFKDLEYGTFFHWKSQAYTVSTLCMVVKTNGTKGYVALDSGGIYGDGLVIHGDHVIYNREVIVIRKIHITIEK